MQPLMANSELFESVCEDRDATHYVSDLEYKEQDAKQKAVGQK
jgi:hypothetical protein